MPGRSFYAPASAGLHPVVIVIHGGSWHSGDRTQLPALNTELAAQTPNEDRVKQLMSERQQNQLKLQGVNRDEDREMQGYLTPVQRARYQEARRRFQERVAELVRQRREQRQHLPAPRARPRRLRP